MLKLLAKLNEELDNIEANYSFDIPEKYYKRRDEINKVYEQQYHKFTTGENPKNRIVSIAKSYERPIVKGKEVKKV